MTLSSPTTQVINHSAHLPNLHYFRGIAILFIVMVHCHDCLEWTENRKVGNILYALLSRGTILFVFISGYLFQHLSARFSFQTYLSKKLYQVILPYFFISIPIIVFRIFTSEYPPEIMKAMPQFDEWTVVAQILFYYITGAHLVPFWFIPMVCIYYLMSPILVKLDRNKVIYYLLPVLLIISMVITRRQLFDIPRMFIHFLSVYVLGMFFSRYKQTFAVITQRIWPWLVALTLLLILASILLYTTAFREQIIFVQKLFFCWIFLFWLEHTKGNTTKILGKLAEVSFGIFFIHYYFLFFFRGVAKVLTGNSFMSGTGTGLLLLLIGVLLLSLASLYLGKKIIGRRSKIILGY